MEKTKTLALAAALTVLAVALIGVAYAQYVSTQNPPANGVYSQTPQTSSPAPYGYPTQQSYYGYCPGSSYEYGASQPVYPYQHGTGFGGFCR